MIVFRAMREVENEPTTYIIFLLCLLKGITISTMDL